MTVAALAAALTVAGGAAAFAWFPTRATGTGSATSSGLTAVTVTALSGGDAPTTALQPGGSADVILRVSNPNHFAVTLVSVQANGAVTATGGSGSCVTTGVSFVNQTGLSIPIAAAGTTLVHLPAGATMSTASPSGCQGATFNLPVSITVQEA